MRIRCSPPRQGVSLSPGSCRCLTCRPGPQPRGRIFSSWKAHHWFTILVYVVLWHSLRFEVIPSADISLHHSSHSTQTLGSTCRRAVGTYPRTSGSPSAIRWATNRLGRWGASAPGSRAWRWGWSSWTPSGAPSRPGRLEWAWLTAPHGCLWWVRPRSKTSWCLPRWRRTCLPWDDDSKIIYVYVTKILYIKWHNMWVYFHIFFNNLIKSSDCIAVSKLKHFHTMYQP